MKTTKTDDLGTGASKRPSNNIERQLPTTTLSNAYPHNFVVQHMMLTIVPQFITSVSQTILITECANLVLIQDITGNFRIPGPLIQVLRHLERRGCLRLADQLSGAWSRNGIVCVDCLHVFSEVEVD
jgi:hypothetical protein